MLIAALHACRRSAASAGFDRPLEYVESRCRQKTANIIIVGGGASGVLLACHLLRNDDDDIAGL
jgi:NADH dehydrogenase FAD-containing subunit